MAGKSSRVKTGLVCTVCKSQNYITEKSKLNTQGPLQLNKYCKMCKKATKHKEAKKLD